MDKFYLGVILFVTAVVLISTAFVLDVFADNTIIIELKDTLTMTDKVILND